MAINGRAYHPALKRRERDSILLSLSQFCAFHLMGRHYVQEKAFRKRLDSCQTRASGYCHDMDAVHQSAQSLVLQN